MNPDDHRDSLIDMLLRELVGSESPPDVRDRVHDALKETPEKSARRAPVAVRKIVPLPKRSAGNPIWAVAATLMLVASVLGFLHFQGIASERTPTIRTVSGSVSHPPGKLSSGQSIVTGPGSTALLVYPDGTRVQLDPETSITIPEIRLSDRSKALKINQGGVVAEVQPQAAGHPMKFTARHAQAVVVGTELSFRTSEAVTRLEVSEGKVRMLPHGSHPPIEVTTGQFAETDASMKSRSGLIRVLPTNRLSGFTLMNADSDQPFTGKQITDGETVVLSKLPTRNLSLRADFVGAQPFSVSFKATRNDGGPTGLKPRYAQHFPPFFATGDHSGSKRPADCRPWTPAPGTYRFTATPTYSKGGDGLKEAASTVVITFVP